MITYLKALPIPQGWDGPPRKEKSFMQLDGTLVKELQGSGLKGLKGGFKHIKLICDVDIKLLVNEAIPPAEAAEMIRKLADVVEGFVQGDSQ